MLREEPLKHYFCPRAPCGRVTAEARGRLRGGVTWCCCERQALLWRLKSKLRTTRPRPTEHPHGERDCVAELSPERSWSAYTPVVVAENHLKLLQRAVLAGCLLARGKYFHFFP